MTKHALSGLVSILVLVVCTGAASPQPTAGPAGHWEGAIQLPAQELKVEVDLVGKAGKWEGTINIPAQNVKGLPLSDVAVDGSTVTFGMKSVPGLPQFKGTLSKDGRSIAGDFSQGGGTMPFSLAWKGEAKIEAPPKSTPITKDLEGSWEGVLDVSGTTLRLVVKLSNQEGSATGTLVSVDQGGVEIPITSITQNASHVKFLVGAVGGAYDGVLKDGQIVGTWTQGPGSLPLVFKRAQK